MPALSSGSTTLSRRDRAQVLKDLYARLPSVKCQRKCANHCGPILPSDLERDRMQEHASRPLTIRPHPLGQGLPMCSMLSHDGACEAYDVRPLICRLWGAVPELPCPHGCEVVNPVPEGAVFEFMREAMRIGGDEFAKSVKPYVELALNALKSPQQS